MLTSSIRFYYIYFIIVYIHAIDLEILITRNALTDVHVGRYSIYTGARRERKA